MIQGRKFPKWVKGRGDEDGRKKRLYRRVNIDDALILLENDPENAEVKEIFYGAVKNQDLEMVSALLSKGVKVEIVNDSKQTAVHMAFALNYPTIIDQLLRNCDKTVNHTDATGLSHFHIACSTGLHSIILDFIKNGFDPNLRVGSDGPTPLQLAVKHVRPEVVKLLLRHGADPNATDKAGRTPLHLACGIHESVGEVILSKKLKSIESKAEEITALRQKIMRIIQQLVKSGSNVNARDRHGESPLFHIFRDDTREYTARKFSRASLDYRIHKDDFRRTKWSIVTSLRTGQHDQLKFLLFQKARVWVRNHETGDTILHRAIKDLDTLRDPREFGEPLFNDMAHARMIEDILKRGLDVNAKNKRGETALNIATSMLSPNVINVLLNHGANSWDIRFDDGFRYPGILPSLEAVDNLLKIIAMKRDSLSVKENLTLLRFLVDNNAQCKYADPQDDDASNKLKNLLEFGTDENVISTLQKITKDDGYSRGIVNDQVSRYLIKLQMNGMYLSKRVKDYLVKVTELADTPDVPHRELNEFKAEAAKMGETRLASGRFLRNILTTPSAEISSLVQRGEHKEILYARYLEFAESFRHNWGIVRGFFAKVLIRGFLVKSLNDQMRFIAAKPLPDHCCEMIASYLSNEDLLRLCVASAIAEVPKPEMRACDLADKLLSNLRVV